MKNIQKVGAIASLALGVSFTVLIGLLITIASQGYVPGSGNNPAKALEFAGSSSIPYIIYLLYALLAILIVLIIMALSDRLKDHAPLRMQVAMIAASATGTFFLGYAMLGYVGEPTLVSLYREDTSLAIPAYMAMRVVSNSLNTSAIVAAGLAILLTGWAGVAAINFPKALAFLLIVAGSVSVSSLAVPVFSMFAPLLYIVWSIWLGLFLLRSSASEVNEERLVKKAA